MVFAFFAQHQYFVALLQAAPAATASLKIIAAIVLVLMICGLLYVLRSLKTLKAERGPHGESPKTRPNQILIVVACAVTFAAACVLLFLMAKG